MGTTDMKLEVVIIPVSDFDRARDFYLKLGWRQDVTPPDVPPGAYQFTPPGSAASVQFGPGFTTATPGSSKEYLVVSDLKAARAALKAAGIEVSEPFHLGPKGVEGGLDPKGRSYFSLAAFNDPDGNTWVLQEITTRLPGRIDATGTSYGSTNDLASALKRAAEAHGKHEKLIGAADPNWPEWYAAYLGAEQSGAELPR